MDCTELNTIFAGDHGEDLDEGASAAFEEHLDSCATCLERLAQAEDELTPLADWSAPEPTPEEWAQVKEGIRSRLDPPALKPSPWNRLPAVLAMAAAMLLLAGLAFVLGNAPQHRAGNNGTQAAFGAEDPQIDPSGTTKTPDSDGEAAVAAAQVVGSVETGEDFDHQVVVWDDLLCVVLFERQ